MDQPVQTDRPALTVGAVLRAARDLVRPNLPAWQSKILGALCACRTPALGGHRYLCNSCGQEHFAPHSCRNRHCPECLGKAALDWLSRQEASLLPIPYFHLVFTLPHDLNPLIQQNLRVMLNLFFASVSATLLEFGRNRWGVELGLTVIVHTWGQTLIDHYHLHVLATGGGLNRKRTCWISAPEHYLFPIHALAVVFRAKFCAGLQDLYAAGQLQFHGQLEPLREVKAFQALIRQATRQSWNVYAKRPLAGPAQVLRYLSRYTHRVAISSRRIQHLDLEHHTVTFTYKDYADHDRIKPMPLSLQEFLRRFCLHFLPQRFVKIRHYGLLGNAHRQERVAKARHLLGVTPPPEPAAEPEVSSDSASTTPVPLPRCPHCGKAALMLIEIVSPPPRPPILDSS
jgi:hypothetical protein